MGGKGWWGLGVLQCYVFQGVGHEKYVPNIVQRLFSCSLNCLHDVKPACTRARLCAGRSMGSVALPATELLERSARRCVRVQAGMCTASLAFSVFFCCVSLSLLVCIFTQSLPVNSLAAVCSAGRLAVTTHQCRRASGLCASH